MKVWTPNLTALRYDLNVPRKLWEAKGRDVVTLQKGDIVLLPSVTAVLLARKNGFSLVENFACETKGELFNLEDIEIPDALETVSQASDDDKAQSKQEQHEALPSVDEMMEFNAKQTKELCKKLKITIGNKNVQTLKQLILPYLES